MTVLGGREVDFGFAFNDLDFSDRILRLEITPDDDGDTGSGKKLAAEKYNDWFPCNQSKDSESSDGAKFTTVHISSPILAAQSPLFNKMFKNGMRDSQQKTEFCLKISASEEATLMDLLRFMYGETALKATSFQDLVDLLIAAYKFEVASCISFCVGMLHKFPMSLEFALIYLELPSSVLKSEIVKPLIDAAKQFVVALYKNFTKSQDEAMKLPVYAIEVVLGSEGLQVVSEDDVFDFVLKWGRASYPELEERREILTKRLAPLVCFPNMSVPKLKEVLACADFDHEHVSKIVVGALFSKIERTCGQLVRDTRDLSTKGFGSGGRVYNPHCVVFFDLTKDECASLFPNKNLESPQFRLGGKRLYLAAYCGQKEDRFGLFVMRKSDSESCTIDFDLSVMKKSSMEFESRSKAKNHTLEVYGFGRRDLLGITWTEFMSDDSDYFINGVLRIKAELTVKA